MASFLSNPGYFSKWQAEAEQLFKETIEPAKVSDSNLAMDTIFKNLKQGMIKQTKLWWEVTTLDKYLGHSIVPRGLRIKLSPAEHLIKEGFLDKWHNILTNCSLNLMRLIKETEEGELGLINIEVENHLKLVQEHRENEAFTRFESELQGNIDKLASELKVRKWKKINRDRTDFATGHVYSTEHPTSDSDLSDGVSQPDRGPFKSNRAPFYQNRNNNLAPQPLPSTSLITPTSSTSSSFLEQRHMEGPAKNRLRDRKRWGYSRRYNRKLLLRKHFYKADTQKQWSAEEKRALHDMCELLEDNIRDRSEMKGPFTNLRPKSTFTPPNSTCTKVETFIEGCTRDLKILHDNSRDMKAHKGSNLTLKERQGLISWALFSF
ncbi:hypothetical protein XELAEV_18047676mg [Xenopus laevis]|uniref:Uncharacterized protein n=1 Tax=Xenopus laevis TaxID=8355 RepID=A0A974BVZ5_XENLA|nr:hypothetical protein XELAEV_18047676mg [Xenopus laevis]